MSEEIQTMLEELRFAGDLTSLAEKEAELAGVTGDGFMEGRISYGEMEGIRTEALEIETERRQVFDKAQSRLAAHVR